MTKSGAIWYVYLVECSGSRIYTGVTPDLAARMRKHARGKGAMFTRLNPPRRLLGVRPFSRRQEAASLERQVKRLSAAQKRLLAGLWSEKYSLDETFEHFFALVQG